MTTSTPTARQRRHESPDVGDAIIRMLRGLVTRAEEGDTEAVEQLARIERLAPVATAMGGRRAHDNAGYSYTDLGRVLGISRQAARQRATFSWLERDMKGTTLALEAHQLVPGHHKGTCQVCATSV